jgi:hypothetical protein
MPPRAAYLDRDGQAHARGMGEPKISDQIRQCRHRVFASRRQIAVPSPTKILAAIEVEGCIFVPAILDVQTEFLVNMKAAAHELAPEKEHVHGHQTVPSDLALRVKALESLLVEKGLVEPAALDALIDTYEHKIGPRNGARVVARAWVDPAYKERLLTDATAAIGELGYTGAQGEHMIAVENTPKLHNLVVCTLCSLLSLGSSRFATGLVQVCALPLACGYRSARSATRIWSRAVGGRRNTCVGQHSGSTLPGTT